jgi:hypothetical protein
MDNSNPVIGKIQHVFLGYAMILATTILTAGCATTPQKTNNTPNNGKTTTVIGTVKASNGAWVVLLDEDGDLTTDEKKGVIKPRGFFHALFSPLESRAIKFKPGRVLSQEEMDYEFGDWVFPTPAKTQTHTDAIQK